MITVFFDETGYCIAGEGIEASRRCSLALTSEGDIIFPIMHHTYKVLYLALCEIRDMQIHEDVMVYNNTRIIDEVNRTSPPLDTSCDEWLKIIHRNIIPTIKSVVFFRKKSSNQINSTISQAHRDMLVKVDSRTREHLAKTEERAIEAKASSKKQRILSNLRNTFFKRKLW